jgi:hypothetical protein
MPVYTKVPERPVSLTDHGGHLINIFGVSVHTFRTYGTKLMRGSISTHLLYLTAQTDGNRKILTAILQAIKLNKAKIRKNLQRSDLASG